VVISLKLGFRRNLAGGACDQPRTVSRLPIARTLSVGLTAAPLASKVVDRQVCEINGRLDADRIVGISGVPTGPSSGPSGISIATPLMTAFDASRPLSDASVKVGLPKR
jgi:hypothetical protein